MLTKLLLVIGVIVLLAVAFRSRGRDLASSESRTEAPASPTRITAWVLIGVIIVVSVGMGLYQQAIEPKTVTVLVINTHTGERRYYQASRDEAGKRSFHTLDGRTIVLAETERAEIHSNP